MKKEKLYNPSLLVEDFIDDFDYNDDEKITSHNELDDILHKHGLEFEIVDLAEYYLNKIDTTSERLTKLFNTEISKDVKFFDFFVDRSINKSIKTTEAYVVVLGEEIEDIGQEDSYKFKEVICDITKTLAEYYISLQILSVFFKANSKNDKKSVRLDDKNAINNLLDKIRNESYIKDLNIDGIEGYLKNLFEKSVFLFSNEFNASYLSGTNYCPKLYSFSTIYINSFLDLWKKKTHTIINDDELELKGENFFSIHRFCFNGPVWFDLDELFYKNFKYSVPLNNSIGYKPVFSAVILNELIKLIVNLKQLNEKQFDSTSFFIKGVTATKESVNEDYIKSYDEDDDLENNIDNVLNKNYYEIGIVENILNHLQEFCSDITFGTPLFRYFVDLKLNLNNILSDLRKGLNASEAIKKNAGGLTNNSSLINAIESYFSRLVLRNNTLYTKCGGYNNKSNIDGIDGEYCLFGLKIETLGSLKDLMKDGFNSIVEIHKLAKLYMGQLLKRTIFFLEAPVPNFELAMFHNVLMLSMYILSKYIDDNTYVAGVGENAKLKFVYDNEGTVKNFNAAVNFINWLVESTEEEINDYKYNNNNK